MMLSGFAVQTKGLELSLVSARNRLIVAWRSTSQWKTPRLRRRLVRFEEALDGIEPRGRGRRIMEREARMSAEPYFHLGVLVTAAIVEDHVDHLAGLGLGLAAISSLEGHRALGGPRLR